MIYEGTNEIQAIDLLVRKVLPDGGRGLAALLEALAAQLDARGDAEVLARFAAVNAVTQQLAAAAAHSDTLPYEAADDYLRAVGLALFGWAWSLITRTPGAEAARWSAPGAAARLRILPEFDLRLQILRTQCAAATPSSRLTAA